MGGNDRYVRVRVEAPRSLPNNDATEVLPNDGIAEIWRKTENLIGSVTFRPKTGGSF